MALPSLNSTTNHSASPQKANSAPDLRRACVRDGGALSSIEHGILDLGLSARYYATSSRDIGVGPNGESTRRGEALTYAPKRPFPSASAGTTKPWI